MKPWLEKVWSKHPDGLKKPFLLVCDQFKAHVTESTKRLVTKLKSHLAVIPGGLTSQLQPQHFFSVHIPLGCRLKLHLLRGDLIFKPQYVIQCTVNEKR